jgi:hypothetical protein
MVPLERIERAIFFFGSRKVMLSCHLAELYEVEPRALAVSPSLHAVTEDMPLRAKFSKGF